MLRTRLFFSTLFLSSFIFSSAAVSQEKTFLSEKDWKSIEELLKLGKDEVCRDPSAEPCIHFNNFLSGTPPSLPAGKFFTVGRLTVDGKLQENRFTALLAESNPQLKASIISLVPDNEQEKKEDLDYIEALKAGKRNTQNSLHIFLESSFRRQQKFETQVSNGFLLCLYFNPQFPTPPILIRQKNKVIYAFYIGLKQKVPGSHDRVPATYFAYFPMP